MKLFGHVLKGELFGYLREVFSVEEIKNMIFFNSSPFCEPLWYLNAILYVTVVILLIDKIGCRRVLYLITPLLIIIDLLLGKYSIFFFGRYFPNVYTRNWLFFGLPNVAIGMMIREWSVIDKIKRKYLTMMCVLFLACLLIEHIILDYLEVNAERDNYIFAVFLSIGAFCLFAKIREAPNRLLFKMASFGKNYSTSFYVIHSFFILILQRQGLRFLLQQLVQGFFHTSSN